MGQCGAGLNICYPLPEQMLHGPEGCARSPSSIGNLISTVPLSIGGPRHVPAREAHYIVLPLTLIALSEHRGNSWRFPVFGLQNFAKGLST